MHVCSNLSLSGVCHGCWYLCCAERCKEARDLEHRLDCMSVASTAVAAHSTAASQQEHKLQEQVHGVHITV